MVRSRIGGPALLVALAACHRIAEIPAPPIPAEARAAVVTFDVPAASSPVRAFAADVSEGAFSPKLAPFTRKGEAHLRAAFYPASIGDLGLVPGEQIDLRPIGQPLLVHAASVYALDLSGDGPAAAWVKSDEENAPILSRLRFKPTVEQPSGIYPCAAVLAEGGSMEVIDDALIFMTALDDRSALVGSERGMALAAVTATSVVITPLVIPPSRVIAGIHTADDLVYLIERSGVVWAAKAIEVSRPTAWTKDQQSFPMHTQPGRVAIDGHGTGGDVDLFVATDLGDIIQYAKPPGDWVTKFHGSRSPAPYLDITWITTGVAIAIGVTATTTTAVTFHFTFSDASIIDAPAPLSAITHVDGIGTLIGARGEVLVDATNMASTFTSIHLGESDQALGFVKTSNGALWALAPGRLLSLGSVGALGVPCEAHRLVSTGSKLVSLGARLLVAEAAANGRTGYRLSVLFLPP